MLVVYEEVAMWEPVGGEKRDENTRVIKESVVLT